MNRRPLLSLAALALLPGVVLAQAYPSKPIRLVVPFPAGGATDLLARSLAQRLGQGLGQTVVVENKSGGGGSLGSAEVAKAAPDGYTLLIATSSTHSIGPHLNPKLPYKTTGRTATSRRSRMSPMPPTCCWCRWTCRWPTSRN